MSWPLLSLDRSFIEPTVEVQLPAEKNNLGVFTTHYFTRKFHRFKFDLVLDFELKK